MSVNIKIPTIDGMTLNTKNKHIKDDIILSVGIPKYRGENSDNATPEIDEFLMGELIEYTNNRITKTKYGFCNNYTIKKVTMKNVVEVGDRTFSGAANLEHIDMPSVKKVGAYGFHGTRLNADNPIFANIEEWEGTNQFYSLSTTGEITMPKVTTIPDACLASCKISKFTAPNVTSLGRQAFSTTTNLVTIDCPNVETLGNQVFQGSGIQYISLNKIKEVGTQMFNGATRLEIAEFDSLEKIIGGMCFYNCGKLKALILRNPSVVTLGPTNAFDNSGVKLGTGFVYIPDNLVEQYKVATNWSVIADRIKGLSEIPQEILDILEAL